MHASEYAGVTYLGPSRRDTTYRDPMAFKLARAAIVAIPSRDITVPTGLFINNEFVLSCDSQERIRSSEQSIILTTMIS